MGPDYKDKSYSKLGQIIGQHHVHMIQKGLPGAGNILLFDNGGGGGYGYLFDKAFLPAIYLNEFKFYSRILEFDPTTYDIKWEYVDKYLFSLPFYGDLHRFFSFYISSAQRLPNGNTLIDEGATGRIIEVTNDKKIVWEYISPYLSLSFYIAQLPGIGNIKGNSESEKFVSQQASLVNQMNAVYRAYRIPSKWLKDEKGNMLKGDDNKALIDYNALGNKCL